MGRGAPNSHSGIVARPVPWRQAWLVARLLRQIPIGCFEETAVRRWFAAEGERATKAMFS
jgi:hypothetical protein